MELRMILTIFSLSLPLLMAVESQTPVTTSANLTNPPQTSTSRMDCTCPTSSCAPCTTQSSAPSLGLLSVNWTDVCEGEVVVLFSGSPSHICYNKGLRETLLNLLCESRKGCEGPLSTETGKETDGYDIKDLKKKTRCYSLAVRCQAQRDVPSPLQAYKVVVALLCCVLIVLFLIRFTRPTVKALQSRLSDRRQNRWVGPTQSHSVSYHRGKAAVQNPDRETRLSYPALERLTVSDSREPSSNRNSGYNF